MRRSLLFLALTLACSCAHSAKARSASDPQTPQAYSVSSAEWSGQEGDATFYSSRLAGRRTANGERYDPSAMTAAHRSLPFGTWVEVTRPDTGASVRVRITDRGPWGSSSRVIDLSRAAAVKLGMIQAGVVHVTIRRVDAP